MRLFTAVLCFVALSGVCAAAHAGGATEPANFLYTSGDLSAVRSLINRPDIAGVQVVYSWKSLEPAKGQYDFSQIAHDLAVTHAAGKKLFIQVQDRFFSVDARGVPAYLTNDPEYGGGLVPQVDNPGEGKPEAYGWVAIQWNSALRARYQALLKALAVAFDGKIFGVNLPETAIDVDQGKDRSGFSCDAYFHAEMDNIAAARADFHKSLVVQYVNFWPCEWDNDHRYMARLFAYAAQAGVGLGGPDVIPYRKGQMKNSYPFFHRYKGKLRIVAMAVQEPTLTYTNPKTGKRFTREEFRDFARDYLGANIIFWSVDTPWLHARP